MHANAAIVADATVGALVEFCVAIFATVSGVTNALDIVSILGTTSSMLAWISCLADCRDLALFSFEVGRTLAPTCVGSGCKVVANRDRNAVVLTEAVVCAEVNLAVDSAKAGGTLALELSDASLDARTVVVARGR